jgi:ferrous iron transport protein B
MYFLFYLTFTLAAYPVAAIEYGVDLLAQLLSRYLPEGLLKELIIDGIVNGVGGVLVFLPNILFLFLGISLFEDTGYLARAAFIMDRVMHFLGLHGKSFIPLLMGFGCNVPAIMATRTLETHRDRVLTILINPLMSCSARLPVYVLFAGAFFPGRESQIIFGIYALGITLAMILGKLFSRVLIKEEDTPFVLELPPYRMPTLRGLLLHMWEKTKVYLQKMGGVIMVCSVILWALTAFPRVDGQPPPIDQSYIGRLGQFLSPVMEPLGFDWQLGVSLATGFVAKEVVVSSLGVLYQVEDEDTHSLRARLREAGFSRSTALAFMVFVLIYIPCVATLVAIWKETGSMKWHAFCVFYEMTLAWVFAFLIHRVGVFLGF